MPQQQASTPVSPLRRRMLDDMTMRGLHEDMPNGAFMTAGEAWLECRAGRMSCDDFGDGEHKGLWFISMTVARDSLILNGREM